MKKRIRRAALAALFAIVSVVNVGSEAHAESGRRNPIVAVVEKALPSIVTVKVDKRGNWGIKEVVGTGVIVDERGYIITNSHVISNSERIAVLLNHGTELVAQVVTDDPNHDLAILRVASKKKLKALPFGPSTDLLVGETVVAVGNPFGYTNTVSPGIVSALGREIEMPSGVTLKELIQTNTAINPGNSGGPLLNVNGELIGINVAVREGAQGIGFTLNSDMVQKVLADRLSAAKLAKVRHGLVVKEQVIAEDGSQRQQVVIEQVADKMPASSGASGKTGLKSGDVLLKFGGQTVANRFDVERALWDCKAGDRIDAVVLRESQETHVSLTLAGAADVKAAAEEKETESIPVQD